jgi:hypothetical protein
MNAGEELKWLLYEFLENADSGNIAPVTLREKARRAIREFEEAKAQQSTT